MTTKLVDMNSLKVNGYVLVDGVACRIVDIKHSKTGKHGHAKARVAAVGLLDGRRREIIKPSDAKAEVPIIEKMDAQVVSITGDKAHVMDLITYETFEMDIPEELRGKVKEGSQVLYWDITGTKVMKQIKG
jgi:translation initiation factor 5A